LTVKNLKSADTGKPLFRKLWKALVLTQGCKNLPMVSRPVKVTEPIDRYMFKWPWLKISSFLSHRRGQQSVWEPVGVHFSP